MNNDLSDEKVKLYLTQMIDQLCDKDTKIIYDNGVDEMHLVNLQDGIIEILQMLVSIENENDD